MLRAVEAKRIHDPRRPVAAPSEETQVLPVWKAFVVQLSRETNARTRMFGWRVEHRSSGRRDEHAERRLAVLLAYRAPNTRRSAGMMTFRPNYRTAWRSQVQSVAV